jgi:hypothetical protein
MTLQDDTTLEQDDTEAPSSTSPTETKPDRTRAEIDAGSGTLKLGDTTYSTAGLSDTVLRYLALVGLQRAVSTAKDPAATYAKLQAGELPGRGGRPAKPKEPNPWKLAYAHAKVESTRRTDAPLTLDQAKAAAEALDREALRTMKTNPLVVKHYAKLTGQGAELI